MSKKRVRQLAGWSIAVAFMVMALKFVAWRMTGSVALLSDALESIVNVIAAAAALWAIRLSHKPADQTHQHGEPDVGPSGGAQATVEGLLHRDRHDHLADRREQREQERHREPLGQLRREADPPPDGLQRRDVLAGVEPGARAGAGGGGRAHRAASSAGSPEGSSDPTPVAAGCSSS